jgi:hypothetical protein
MFKLIFSSLLIYTFITFNAHASDHNLCEGSPVTIGQKDNMEFIDYQKKKGFLWDNCIGKYEYFDGEVYEGFFSDGQRNGFGVRNYVNGDKYEGFWSKDYFNGDGTYVWSNGDYYEGEYKDGQKHGYGVLVWTNGARYEGYWEASNFNGKGTYTYLNGDIIESNWKNGKKNDNQAYLTNANGDYYEVVYKDDIEISKKELAKPIEKSPINSSQYEECVGSPVFVSEKDYEPSFIEYQKKKGFLWDNCIGKYEYYKGNRFEGIFVNGKKEGKGIYNYADGGKYDGNWFNDYGNGYGTRIIANGAKYEGEFLDGYYHGKGKYTFRDGDTFEGEFVNGKRADGYGVYTFPSGEKYEGEFLDGYYHGKGTLTFANGDVVESMWQNGKKNDNQAYLTKANGDYYEMVYKDDIEISYKKLTKPIKNDPINTQVTNIGQSEEIDCSDNNLNLRVEHKVFGVDAYDCGVERISSIKLPICAGSPVLVEDKYENFHEYQRDKGIIWNDCLGEYESKVYKERYFGEFTNNAKNGEGVIIMEENNVFDGKFQNGNFSYGKLTYSNGYVFKGEFKDNSPNGLGLLKSPYVKNGLISGGYSVYEGEIKDSIPHGTGKLKFGDEGFAVFDLFGINYEYDGEWKNGKKNGYGEYLGAGWSYKGYWVDDLYEGFGLINYGSLGNPTESYPESKNYLGVNNRGNEEYTIYYGGDWKAGRFHGQGELTYGERSCNYYGECNWITNTTTGVFKDGVFLFENAVVSNEDEQFCLDIGFKKNTPEFDKCINASAKR